MKRVCILGVALVLASSITATDAVAQSKYLWIGGAMTQPMGDTKEAYESGFLADVGLGIPMGGDKLSLHIGGLYGGNDFKGFDVSTDLMGGYVGFGYSLTSGAKINPYVMAHGGMMRAKSGDNSESKGMFAVGGGLHTSLSDRVGLWADVRYLSVMSDPKFTLLPIAAGITINLGGN